MVVLHAGFLPAIPDVNAKAAFVHFHEDLRWHGMSDIALETFHANGQAMGIGKVLGLKGQLQFFALAQRTKSSIKVSSPSD